MKYQKGPVQLGKTQCLDLLSECFALCMLKGWVRCWHWLFSLLFRVDMSRQVSWQPSKSWTLRRWAEEQSTLLTRWVKFNNKRWHMAYLVFILKGIVLACGRLLSVCRTWPLQPICPLWDFCSGPSGLLHRLLWLVPGHMSRHSTPFSDTSQKRGKTSDSPLPTFFS